MSSSLLGEQIDLHTGGEDNIFPHHECEIAQSEGAMGREPFVRCWLHKRHIDLGSTKMSKSLGNVLTLPDIVTRGYSPLDFRYCLLSVHYRTNLKFTWKGMDDAKKARGKILEWMDDVSAQSAQAVPHPAGQTDAVLLEAHQRLRDAFDGDLNTPSALSEVFGVMNAYYAARTKKQPLFTEDLRELLSFIHDVRETFGCFVAQQLLIPSRVKELLSERAVARKQKDFAASDRLRDAILGEGYVVRDGAAGQEVRKV
jgi:cysteinyl-tRNA synthetase